MPRPANGFGERWEARVARTALGAEQTGVTHFRLRPGKRSPFTHRHVEAEEVYVILGRQRRVKLDDEIADVRPARRDPRRPRGGAGVRGRAGRPRVAGLRRAPRRRRRARRRSLDRLTYSGSRACARMRRSASRSSAPSAASAGGRRGEDRVRAPRQLLALARRLDDLRPAGRSGARAGAPGPGLEVVDHHGRVGRLDPQRVGELAHRHRPPRQPAQRARAAEAHAERVGDLAPALVVEHEVGHQQPGLARGVVRFGHRYAASASGLSWTAVRRRDSLARCVVAEQPERSTTPPHALSVHHAGWLAAARPAPPACGGHDRPGHRDAERRADLARRGGDRRRHARLGARHPGDGGVRDRRVDQPEAEPEDHVGHEQQRQRASRRRCRSAARLALTSATPAITSGSRGRAGRRCGPRAGTR
jgi:hypothetical protein